MTHLNKSILIALLDLAQLDQAADLHQLSLACGQTSSRIRLALYELESLGFVDAGRVRLSFLGLAKAAGLRARARRLRAA